MQVPRDFSESQLMHGIAVALLTEDREQLGVLQNRLESTHMTRNVFSHLGLPISTTDPVVRQPFQLAAFRLECPKLGNPGRRQFPPHL